tara:strand:- start:135 stop:758 length:624 start_codon:yes stop_codon:yes gene_type:complete
MLFIPKKYLYRPAYFWIGGVFVLLESICQITYDVKGQEYINNSQAKIIASKHQSAFETLLLFYLIPKATFIHKYELFLIPIFGLYLKKINMVSINRSKGHKSLKKMLSDSKEKISKGFTLIIFPEGTRKQPGEKTDYKSGVAGIYKELDTDVIPVAVNSGLFWSKKSLHIKPGKIILEFLPPIHRGLEKEDFLNKLENSIEDRMKEI